MATLTLFEQGRKSPPVKAPTVMAIIMPPARRLVPGSGSPSATTTFVTTASTTICAAPSETKMEMMAASQTTAEIILRELPLPRRYRNRSRIAARFVFCRAAPMPKPAMQKKTVDEHALCWMAFQDNAPEYFMQTMIRKQVPARGMASEMNMIIAEVTRASMCQPSGESP